MTDEALTPTIEHGHITPSDYRSLTIAKARATIDLFEKHPDLHPDPPAWFTHTGTIAHLSANSAAHLRFLLDQMDTVEVNERMTSGPHSSQRTLWLDCTVDGHKVVVTGDWETIDPPQPPEQTIAERRAALVASLVTPALSGPSGGGS